jgi:hypothetical protein
MQLSDKAPAPPLGKQLFDENANTSSASMRDKRASYSPRRLWLTAIMWEAQSAGPEGPHCRQAGRFRCVGRPLNTLARVVQETRRAYYPGKEMGKAWMK